MIRRKYLYRLIAMIILTLMVPMTIFLNFFWRRAFEGMEQANEVYYESVLESYISLCDNKLRELEKFVVSFSVDSKEPSSLFYKGAEEISDDPYQYYMIANELIKNYSISNVSSWGIYFYDTGKIMKPGTVMSYEQYLQGYLDKDGENERLLEFWDEESYSMSKMLFSTYKDSRTQDNVLLVGICTRVGKYNDRALMFFALTPENISDSLIIMREPGVACYLMEKEGKVLLTGWGADTDVHAEAILSGEEYREIAGMKQKLLYQKNSDFSSISVAIYITGEAQQSHIIMYVHGMRKILLFMVFALFVMSICAIYISYKPIYELVNELDYTSGSEFDVIRGVLDKRRTKIMEQEMMIMDLLLNNLVCGVHVSEKEISNLGIDQSLKYYCVFLLKGYVLLSGEVEKLTEEIYKKQHARLFVTDWEEGEDSIFIVFSKSDQKKEVKEVLTQWIKECFIEEYDLYEGNTVEKLDDIQSSLCSCLEQVKNKEDADKKEDEDKKTEEEKKEPRRGKHAELKEEILAYLEENYRDANLSQTEVADLFGISNYTLSRLFKNKVGVGFAEYLVAKRIEYASELLLTSAYSVSEIAAMAGFSSINHFSKTFKLYMGVSATVYRNQE